MSTSLLGERSGSETWRSRRVLAVVDVVESVRLMQAHEDDVIARWRGFVNEVRTEVLPETSGRMVKSLGDGMLLEFEYAPRALASAFEMQRRVARWNEGFDEDRRIQLRVGLHVAEVVADEIDVYGAGVNLAARLAGVARPGGVAASVEIVDEVLPGVDAQLEDAGLCYLKHIAEPVQVYHLAPVPEGLPMVGAGLSIAPPAVRPTASEPSLAVCVAVLPIAATAGDDEQSTLAAVAGDILLTRLATVPMLRVISRLSIEQYRLRGLDAAGIASHCGASYLVAGRLHGRGSQCLLFLELIDAASQEVLWADSLPLDPASLLRRDEDVTPGLAQVLVDHIVSHQLRRVAVSPLPNLASQTLQFSAIYLMHRQARAQFDQSREVLEHLVDRHPKASAPHAWLAKWHVLRVTKGWIVPTGADGAKALGHVHRALDLNPDSALAMAMDAFVHCHMLPDLALAEQRLAQALDLDPNEPWSWLVRSTLESHLGHGEQAWFCAQRARELSPMDPLKHYYDSLGASAAVAAERWIDADRLGRLSLSKDSRHLPTLRAVAIAQVHLGHLDAARTTVGKVLQVQPDFTLSRYVASAPPGGETIRKRWAEALREAGAPMGS